MDDAAEDTGSVLAPATPSSMDLDDCVPWAELMMGVHDMNTNEPENLQKGDLIKDEIRIEPLEREKLTCAERRKRETRALRVQIEQLQHELARLASKSQAAFACAQEKWGAYIDEQICSKAIASHRNTHLRRKMAHEKKICMKLKVLLRKMIAPVEASAFFSRQPSGLVKVSRDDAIFNMLDTRVDAKWQAGPIGWQLNAIPVDGDDIDDFTSSHNGLLNEFHYGRYLPFDVPLIDHALWHCDHSSFCVEDDKSAVLNSTSDTFTFKQEIQIQRAAGDEGPMLQLWSLGKRFIVQRYVVILWEAIFDWLTASGEVIVSTRESGACNIQSIVDDVALEEASAVEPFSLVQAFVQITRSDCDHLHTIQRMIKSGSLTNLVLPSLPQVLISRLQRVENQLMDTLLVHAT